MSDTPETDKVMRDATISADAGDSLPLYTAMLKHARRLERQRDEWMSVSIAKQKRLGDIREQRDAYAETLKEIVNLAREWQGGSERFIMANEFIELACKARERHTELAEETP